MRTQGEERRSKCQAQSQEKVFGEGMEMEIEAALTRWNQTKEKVMQWEGEGWT